MPQRVPIVTYPNFDGAEGDSLLKRHLSRELWSQLKKKSTPKGGNIQMCVRAGTANPPPEIGLHATDDEAYKVFADLF